ncbi:hypothetical protein AB0I30_10785 [Nocardia tengchongensis]|uniref:hypothetical protein n=1 Tax=Nocardia tengchongensis TaxID=2055889 RepID=UPI0034016C44
MPQSEPSTAPNRRHSEPVCRQQLAAAGTSLAVDDRSLGGERRISVPKLAVIGIRISVAVVATEIPSVSYAFATRLTFRY